MMAGTSLEDLRILRVAESVADAVWDQIAGWDTFAQETVGGQLVRAVDSIGANIAEAFGRYHYGEKIQFLYYARGSLYETKYWVNRSARRRLLDEQEAEKYANELSELAYQLNAFVRSLKSQRAGKGGIGALKEEVVSYTLEIDKEPDFIPSVELEWLLTDPSAPLPQSLISNLQSQNKKDDANDH